MFNYICAVGALINLPSDIILSLIKVRSEFLTLKFMSQRQHLVGFVDGL